MEPVLMTSKFSEAWLPFKEVNSSNCRAAVLFAQPLPKVGVEVATGVKLGLDVGVLEDVVVAVLVGVEEAAGVGVKVGVNVPVGVGVPVEWTVPVGLGEDVLVAVGVATGVPQFAKRAT